MPQPSADGVLPEDARILVAEDTMMNRTLLKVVLKKLGIGHVDLVEDGRQAVEAYKAARWDVIIMDCYMPEMNGYEASRAIRQLEAHTKRQTPIVAVTANAMKGDQEKCFAAGMDDYISKPLSFEKLWAVLGRWVRFPALETEVSPPSAQAIAESGQVPQPQPAKRTG